MDYRKFISRNTIYFIFFIGIFIYVLLESRRQSYIKTISAEKVVVDPQGASERFIFSIEEPTPGLFLILITDSDTGSEYLSMYNETGSLEINKVK